MALSHPRLAARRSLPWQALNVLEKLGRQLRETFRHWRAVKAQRLGAALAYYTIFSLAPLLIIAIVIAGAVFGQAAAQDRIVAEIGYLMGPQGAAGVASLLEQRPFPGRSGLLPTIISVVTLIMGAIGLFGQLEDAFDTVWEVTPPPAKGLGGAIRQRILPFGMVLAVAFLLLVALVINAALAAISVSVGPNIPYFTLLNTVINLILPLVVSTLLFAALFKSVPHVRLKWRDLWPGAALTAVLFTLGKIGIGLYLGHSSLANASGATGSLLVVLVWVYYSVQILLFGAVFTRVYARERSGPAAPDRPPAPAVTAAPRTPAPLEQPRPGCLGALLAFAAGLGAGILVALRRKGPTNPTG